MMILFNKRFFFWAITLLALFLRFYRMADTPHDLYVDEVAIGWNAYSVLKTGRDEYGQFLPLSFRSFNDYKLPGYIYGTVISEAIFGKNAFAVRLPSVIFGTLTIPIFILLLELTTKNEKFALLGGLLLSIAPWHLQFTRAAFETSLSVWWIVLGTYLVLLFFIKRQATFFWGILSYIMALYTYHSPRISVPLLLLTILWLFRDKIHLIWQEKYAKLKLIICILFLIPFAVYATSAGGLARATSESFLKDYKADSKQPITFWALDRLAHNYISYYSVDFLFFSGDQSGRHSVREMGMLYLWQFPFIVGGLVSAFKKRDTMNKFFLLWLLISPLPATLATPDPHALRSLLLILPITYFICLGILLAYEKVSRNWRKRLVIGSVVVVGYFMMLYLDIYYIHYANRASPDWSGGYKEAFTSLALHANTHQPIFITRELNQGYIYLYFYGNFDPRAVQFLTSHDSIGKYHFIQSPLALSIPPHSLYLAPFWENYNGKLIDTFYDHGGGMIARLWEN